MDNIYTQRLDLIPLSAAFLELSLAGDFDRAAEILGVPLAPDWKEEQWLMDLRLGQIKADPETEEWLLRAVILRDAKIMVGQIGFHDKPGAEYLEGYAPNGLEIGYRVYEGFRRRGYAIEAVRGLMSWARKKNPDTPFVVSISPDNVGSLRIAEILGFQRIGEHMDDIDGLEYIFLQKASPDNGR